MDLKKMYGYYSMFLEVHLKTIIFNPYSDPLSEKI